MNLIVYKITINVGYTTRWPRNRSQKALKEFWTRIGRI